MASFCNKGCANPGLEIVGRAGVEFLNVESACGGKLVFEAGQVGLKLVGVAEVESRLTIAGESCGCGGSCGCCCAWRAGVAEGRTEATYCDKSADCDDERDPCSMLGVRVCEFEY